MYGSRARIGCIAPASTIDTTGYELYRMAPLCVIMDGRKYRTAGKRHACSRGGEHLGHVVVLFKEVGAARSDRRIWEVV